MINKALDNFIESCVCPFKEKVNKQIIEFSDLLLNSSKSQLQQVAYGKTLKREDHLQYNKIPI